MSCIDYHKGEAWELEEPVPCPDCGEWFELQDSRQSSRDAMRLICPDCFDAELENPELEDISTEEMEAIGCLDCQADVQMTGEPCQNTSKAFVRYAINGRVLDQYVCKMHLNPLIKYLDKNGILYKSEII